MNSCEGSAVFGFRRFNRNNRSTKIVFFVWLGLQDDKLVTRHISALSGFFVSMKGSAGASQELSVLMTVTKRHIRLLAKTAASH